MFIPTHLVISDYLHENILKNTNIYISKLFLSYGSIAPDILPKYKTIRHFKDISYDYIIDRIALLYEKSLHNKISIVAFSFQLGLITHYLSDFFCLPHNDKYFSNHIKEHMIYESKLHIQFKHYNNNINNIISVQEFDFSNKENIKYLIDSLHKSYMENTPGHQNDINYTIKAISILSISLLNSVYVKNTRLFAKAS